MPGKPESFGMQNHSLLDCQCSEQNCSIGLVEPRAVLFDITSARTWFASIWAPALSLNRPGDGAFSLPCLKDCSSQHSGVKGETSSTGNAGWGGPDVRAVLEKCYGLQ